VFTLITPLSKISIISPRFLKSLERLGLKTVGDLVWHFPNRYEDFSQIYKISDLEPGQEATINGLVKEVEIRRSWRKRMVIVEATIEDESGEVRAVWFNQPYLKNIIKPGRMMNFSGKVALGENEVYLSHPDYELTRTSRRSETRHTARLVPIYPETRGLTSRALRFLVQPVLKDLIHLQDFLPEEILKEQNLPNIDESIRKIHFPDDLEQTEKIRRRFAFENLFLLQLFNIQQKIKLAQEHSPRIETDIPYVKKIVSALPFELTPSQKKSFWEIIKDLDKDRPMNRLLQGDVGSGKTIVAVLTALLAAKNGFQAAFMAPTEVLANQHFKTMKLLLKRLGEKVADEILPAFGILTSSGAKVSYDDELGSEVPKKNMLKKIQTGEVKIVIGTHSLIQKDVKFKNLGLVIVDEQHRFGVRQRAELLKTSSGLIPHFLSMSATPIPRTLMLTIFGDLDISIIDELPKGRKRIITKIVAPENRGEAYEFIRKEAKNGRQVFVICPRIEKPEAAQNEKEVIYFQKNFEVKSVKEEFEKLSKNIFPDLRVQMIHGQLKAKEKEKIMHDFSERKTDILVSTSVIEVGVDIPNATIMMIEGSDRFGLAQLYQFRGRVGRGEHQSYCFLFTDSKGETTQRRLKAILEAKNGFELAERDLKFRGPGEFLGRSQTGLPDLAMSGLQDFNLIKNSREAALGILKTDSRLKKYPLLKSKLDEFQKIIHPE
jgi:ATP-dependent DNA helicase RecG